MRANLAGSCILTVLNQHKHKKMYKPSGSPIGKAVSPYIVDGGRFVYEK